MGAPASRSTNPSDPSREPPLNGRARPCWPAAPDLGDPPRRTPWRSARPARWRGRARDPRYGFAPRRAGPL